MTANNGDADRKKTRRDGQFRRCVVISPFFTLLDLLFFSSSLFLLVFFFDFRRSLKTAPDSPWQLQLTYRLQKKKWKKNTAATRKKMTNIAPALTFSRVDRNGNTRY